MNAAVPSGNSGVVADADIFQSEAALIRALSVVRQSALPPETKDAIRDLFLDYAGESNEPEREALKANIRAELAKHPPLASLLPTGSAKKAPPAETSGPAVRTLGHTRPTPVFAAASPHPAEKEPLPASSAISEAAVSHAEAAAMKPVEAPVPKPPVAEPVQAAVTPSPAAASPAPEVPPVPPPPAEPAAFKSGRGRIDEIKRDINSRIGNPVNLITADETIGREYMSALLDAMKQTASGGGVEKLTRLEQAYKAASDLINSKGLGKKDAVEQPATAAEPVPAAAVQPAAPTQPPAPPQSAAAPIVVPPPPAPLTAAAPEPEPAAAIIPPTGPSISDGLYHQPVDELDAKQAEPRRKPALGIASLTGKLFKANEEVMTPAAPSAGQTANAGMVRKVAVRGDARPAETSEAKLQPLQATATALPEKMAALKAQAQRREEDAKRPITSLDDPQIDAGLRQLLSEWSLFKRSGFLGTGPAGIDHPLYKKLAPLPMAAVISGRFEGSTPEIKHSLTDYMNGWRYEQGVLHEMGETFEHYLRRVIRQILEMKRMSIKI